MEFLFSYSLFRTRYVKHTYLLIKVHDLLTLIHITRVSVIDLIIYITFVWTVQRWDGRMEYDNGISGHNCFYALFCSLIKNTQESLHAKNIHKALFLLLLLDFIQDQYIVCPYLNVNVTSIHTAYRFNRYFISLQALRNFFMWIHSLAVSWQWENETNGKKVSVYNGSFWCFICVQVDSKKITW